MTNVAKSNEMKRFIDLILSFFVPIVILIVAYELKGIYPGGPHTVFAMDLHGQYMPFFASLRYLGNTDNSIFINMSGALANNFMGFAYYIFSPFTWITTLFSLEALPTAFYLITVLKIGLCGFSFCYYLLYTYDEEKHFLGALLLACCYALMSYNIGYSINLMWLDGVLLLPWILVGAERIFKGKKPILFIAMIAVSMVCNYYITYMSMIFVAFYIMARFVELDIWSLKRVLYFVFNALCGIALSMPLILPGVIALKNGKMDEEAYPIINWFRYNIFDVLSQLMAGRYDTVYDDGLPLIFCGTGTLVLVLFLMIKGKMHKTDKRIFVLLILIYIWAMCFVPLDRVMHGFRETTCFEVRYSYTFSCLLLIMAYRGIDSFLDVIKRAKVEKLIKILAVIFVVTELFMNSSIIIAGLMVELHYKTTEEYERILNTKKDLLSKIDDDGFYRLSDNCAYTYNDGAWLGYNGFGYFSSCYNLALMDFFGDIGECQSYHVMKDKQRTPLEECLFGAKYKLSYANDLQYDEVIDTHGIYVLSENHDALALGYMISSKKNDLSQHMTGNAFKNQNILAEELSGIDRDIFTELNPYEYKEMKMPGLAKHVECKVRTKETAPVWLYVEKADIAIQNEKSVRNIHEASELIINGESRGPLRSDDSFYLIYLGRYGKDENITVVAESTVYFEKVQVAYMDETAYSMVHDRLDDEQLNISYHRNGRFHGTINTKNGGDMLLTLPAINGWKVCVDGKKVDTGNYRGVLLTVPLSSGEHDVDIRFVSPGLVVGALIGLLALCGSIFANMLIKW